jgi:hypothetical protein
MVSRVLIISIKSLRFYIERTHAKRHENWLILQVNPQTLMEDCVKKSNRATESLSLSLIFFSRSPSSPLPFSLLLTLMCV